MFNQSDSVSGTSYLVVYLPHILRRLEKKFPNLHRTFIIGTAVVLTTYAEGKITKEEALDRIRAYLDNLTIMVIANDISNITRKP